ncbi:MAG: hypothetical protein AB1673_09535 [Actinomycetota bacterium]
MSTWPEPWPEYESAHRPPTEVPEGALAGLPAAPLRQVMASYMVRDGADVVETARALGLDKGYALAVISGELATIDARTVRRLSDHLNLAPEDIWGGELGAAIGWVYGPLSPADLQWAPAPPAEPVYPTLPELEPPDFDL